jgi:excisionase family DNA binding protein
VFVSFDFGYPGCMTLTASEVTVLPPEKPLDDLLAMVEDISNKPGQPGSAELVGPNGRVVALPTELVRVLSAVITAMANGQAITIAPHHQVLTTQEAADLLGISRPTLVRLLDAGRIPFEQPGRHRRIRLQDVLDYAETQRHERREGLDELVRVGEEAGMYDATTTPIRTR